MKEKFGDVRIFVILSSILAIVIFVMPQYFGLHILFDFTLSRILNVLIIGYFILNRKMGCDFIQYILKSKLLLFILPFFIVIIYTTILRADINTFFQTFCEIITLYMMIYGISYGIGIKRFLKWSIILSYLLSLYGFIEYLCGFSLYLKFLKTVPSAVGNVYRSGQYRIMGPCGHPLAYGLFLIVMIAIACIDYDKDEIYLFRRPILILLLLVNVLLTGSRSSLGFVLLEFFLIFLFSKPIYKKKSLLYIAIVLMAFVIFELLFFNTKIGQYMLMQFASVIDQVLGTEYGVLFGAELSRLQDSEMYRSYLPKIFKVEWLNPLLGRGATGTFKGKIDGVSLVSIDNFYIAQYIRYAYPGMISYIFFILCNLFMFGWKAIQRKSGICQAVLIGATCYFINLYWLDTLQTLKYVYILFAIFYAYENKTEVWE